MSESETKKIIKELSIKYNIEEKEIQEIIKSPFLFIRNINKETILTENETKESFNNKTKNFNIPKLGKIYANYNNYLKIKQRKDETRKLPKRNRIK